MTCGWDAARPINVRATATGVGMHVVVDKPPMVALLVVTNEYAAAVTDTARAGEEESLQSGTDTIKRDGAWRVASRLRIASATGAIKLDFREATFAADTIDIDIQSGTGAVNLARAGDR